jgi:DMSO reductase anchor subunit
MSNEVTFEDGDTLTPNRNASQKASGGILVWLVKQRIAKDAKEAEKLLLIVAVVFILIAIGIFGYAFSLLHPKRPADWMLHTVPILTQTKS